MSFFVSTRLVVYMLVGGNFCNIIAALGFCHNVAVCGKLGYIRDWISSTDSPPSDAAGCSAGAALSGVAAEAVSGVAGASSAKAGSATPTLVNVSAPASSSDNATIEPIWENDEQMIKRLYGLA